MPGNFVPEKTIGFAFENRAVLLTQDGNTLSILPAKEVSLFGFNHSQVIVSGEYSACNKAITIDNQSNIQQL